MKKTIFKTVGPMDRLVVDKVDQDQANQGSYFEVWIRNEMTVLNSDEARKLACDILNNLP